MSKRIDFLTAAASSRQGGCILWPFAIRQSSGYGAYSVSLGRKGRNRNVDAHVAACEMRHGPRPSATHQAAHSCGYKLCCNGNHLRWATPAENMADAKAHGTLKGGGRWRPRFSGDDMIKIQSSTLSLVDLARKYNSDPAYMGRLRRKAA